QCGCVPCESATRTLPWATARVRVLTFLGRTASKCGPSSRSARTSSPPASRRPRIPSDGRHASHRSGSSARGVSEAFRRDGPIMNPFSQTPPTADTLETVQQHVAAERAVLVDVREVIEWQQGAIAGAVLLPLSELGHGMDRETLAQRLPAG